MSKRIMIGLVATICLVALILVIVGVSTHEEPGLLTACDEGHNRVSYTGSCYDIVWDVDQIPLVVFPYTNNPYPVGDPHESTEAAIDYINAQLGFELFVMGSGVDADVVVEIGASQEVGDIYYRDSNGFASHSYSHQGLLRCDVRTWNTSTLSILDNVLIHELLHAAGLDHDPFEDSAMYPITRANGPRPRITDSDRETLMSLYAQE